MFEITEQDILRAIEEVIKDIPPIEIQRRSVELIDAMVAKGISEDKALNFVFEKTKTAKH